MNMTQPLCIFLQIEKQREEERKKLGRERREKEREREERKRAREKGAEDINSPDHLSGGRENKSPRYCLLIHACKQIDMTVCFLLIHSKGTVRAEDEMIEAQVETEEIVVEEDEMIEIEEIGYGETVI